MANAQVGVAIANRFPQITLTGNIGSTALAFSQLFSARNGRLAHGRQYCGNRIRRGNAAEPRAGLGRELEHNGSAISKHRSHGVPKCRRHVKGVAGKFAHTRSGHRRQAIGGAGYRPRAPPSRTRTGEPADPAQCGQAYLQTSLARVQAEAARLSDTVALFQALGGGWWNNWEAQTVLAADLNRLQIK